MKVKFTFYIFNFTEKRQFRLSGWKRGTSGTGRCHDIKYSFDALKRSNILAAEGEVAFFVCPGQNFATERLPDWLSIETSHERLKRWLITVFRGLNCTWRVDNFSTRRLQPSRISEELRSCPEAVVRETTLHSPMPCWSTSRSRSAVKGSGISRDVYRQVQKWFPSDKNSHRTSLDIYLCQNSDDQWGPNGSRDLYRRTEYQDLAL